MYLKSLYCLKEVFRSPKEMNKCIRYASKDSLDPLLSHDHNNVEKLNYVLVLEI